MQRDFQKGAGDPFWSLRVIGVQGKEGESKHPLSPAAFFVPFVALQKALAPAGAIAYPGGNPGFPS